MTISSATELIKLANDVNNGTDYRGTTVFLDADIDFAGRSAEFPMIGCSDEDVLFCGVFDGQGHVIRNLDIESAAPYAGLFGATKDASIKNTVMDASCTVTSTFSDPNYIYTQAVLSAFHTRR